LNKIDGRNSKIREETFLTSDYALFGLSLQEISTMGLMAVFIYPQKKEAKACFMRPSPL